MAAARISSAVVSAGEQAAHDPAAIHHQDAVTNARKFHEIGGQDQDRGAPCRKFAEQPVDFHLCRDIDGDRRFVEDIDIGFGAQPFCQHHLLLVAAAEVAQPRLRPGVLMPSRAIRPSTCCRFKSSADQSEAREPGQAGERHILPHRDIEGDPWPRRSSGTSPSRRATARAGEGMAAGLPWISISPPSTRLRPKIVCNTSLAPDPTQTGEAENFSRMQA